MKFLLEKLSVEINNEGNLEVFKGKSDTERKESDEQPDTTDMSELESEKSAEEKKSTRKRTKNTNTRSNAQQITNYFSSIKSRK